MLNWLSRIRRNGLSRTDDPDVRSLAQMRADLATDPSEFPIRDLRPVLIPTEILSVGNWVGPFHRFESLPVSLAWAYLRPSQTMMYLSTQLASALEVRGIDWRRDSRSSLRQDFERAPWTHQFGAEGEEIQAVALLHPDGLGPSRLLCYDGLLRRFPSGFTFFVPERSSALVLSKTASEKIRGSVQRAVQGCLKAAAVPMSANEFDCAVLYEALTEVDGCA